MIDHVFLWVGFIVSCLAVIAVGIWVIMWFADRIFSHFRHLKMVFKLYWRFYSTIKELPEGNYRKYRVTWDRNKGEFTDAEGIR